MTSWDIQVLVLLSRHCLKTTTDSDQHFHNPFNFVGDIMVFEPLSPSEILQQQWPRKNVSFLSNLTGYLAVKTCVKDKDLRSKFTLMTHVQLKSFFAYGKGGERVHCG